jgi:hypothetical protein
LRASLASTRCWRRVCWWLDPQAWFAARPWLTANPRSLARAESLDARALDALLNTREAFDGVARIIGLGGGTAIDTAKYLAWRTGLPLILVPSALTVDAPFTDSAAVRRDGRIHYTGSVAPEAVIVDAALIRTAPAHRQRHPLPAPALLPLIFGRPHGVALHPPTPPPRRRTLRQGAPARALARAHTADRVRHIQRAQRFGVAPPVADT